TLVMQRPQQIGRLAFYAGIWVPLALLVAAIGVLADLCVPGINGDMSPCPLPLTAPLNFPEAWIWPLVFTILSVIAISASVTVIYKFGRRSVMVRDLRNDVSRPLKSTGRLDGKGLRDLLELGHQSEPGPEK